MTESSQMLLTGDMGTYKMRQSLTLYQLMPKRELCWPSSHKLRGSTGRDEVIKDAMFAASPSRGVTSIKTEFERMLITLFWLVHAELPKRSYSRAAFWHTVAHRWEVSSHVFLDVDVVRDFVLCFCRAERKWQGAKTANPYDLLRLVRDVNAYLQEREPDSDEAMEVLEEMKARNGQFRNVFSTFTTQPIPWTDLSMDPVPPAMSKSTRRRANRRLRKKADREALARDVEEIEAMFAEDDDGDVDMLDATGDHQDITMGDVTRGDVTVDKDDGAAQNHEGSGGIMTAWTFDLVDRTR